MGALVPAGAAFDTADFTWASVTVGAGPLDVVMQGLPAGNLCIKMSKGGWLTLTQYKELTDRLVGEYHTKRKLASGESL